MSMNEIIKNQVLNSGAYHQGNDITLSSTRAMFSDSLSGVDRATVNKALAELCDHGLLVRTTTGTYNRASRGGHWLRQSWRKRTNQKLFGDEYDSIMAVAS